jgi:hypothetical protein
LSSSKKILNYGLCLANPFQDFSYLHELSAIFVGPHSKAVSGYHKISFKINLFENNLAL